MKATGIVRRIDAGVIITPKSKNRINTGFSLILSNSIYIKRYIHRKSEMNFASLLL